MCLKLADLAHADNNTGVMRTERAGEWGHCLMHVDAKSIMSAPLPLSSGYQSTQWPPGMITQACLKNTDWNFFPIFLSHKATRGDKPSIKRTMKTTSLLVVQACNWPPYCIVPLPPLAILEYQKK